MMNARYTSKTYTVKLINLLSITALLQTNLKSLGFNIEVQQVIVDRIPDAESGSPVSYAGVSSTAAALA